VTFLFQQEFNTSAEMTRSGNKVNEQAAKRIVNFCFDFFVDNTTNLLYYIVKIKKGTKEK
jgi:hypothetical protein